MTNFDFIKKSAINDMAKHIYENVCSGECCCCSLVTPNCSIDGVPVEFLSEDIKHPYNCVIHWLRAEKGEVHPNIEPYKSYSRNAIGKLIK